MNCERWGLGIGGGGLGIGDWGWGMGDWGLGPIPNPQSPIPNPQFPIPNPQNLKSNNKRVEFINLNKDNKYLKKWKRKMIFHLRKILMN